MLWRSSSSLDRQQVGRQQHLTVEVRFGRGNPLRRRPSPDSASDRGPPALAPDEVTVRGRRDALTRQPGVAVHPDAHRAPRLAPFEARVDEEFVEPLGLGLALDQCPDPATTQVAVKVAGPALHGTAFETFSVGFIVSSSLGARLENFAARIFMRCSKILQEDPRRVNAAEKPPAAAWGQTTPSLHGPADKLPSDTSLRHRTQ